MYSNASDTICAVATAPGGAIGIVRISGDRSIAIASSIFSRDLTQAATHTVHYGSLSHGLDEALVTVFRAPHSYTGEDSVEISCHGSQYILTQLCRLLIDRGCRQAQPGEFTQRAFLNGKLDLAQAEAVADLIATRTAAQHRMAMSQLRGTFSRHIDQLHERLQRLTALMELELDFADHEELEFADRSELIALCNEIEATVSRLCSSFATGNAIKEGVRVAIAGPTNAGKSTLLNAIVHDQRAIVSDIHGTTRDTIEDTFVWQGITFRFIDTAGLRDTADTIEQIGISRSRQAIASAHIVLFVVDINTAQADLPTLQPVIDSCQCPHIIVYNKVDRGCGFQQQNQELRFPTAPTQQPSALDSPTLFISALTGQGLDSLQQWICDTARQQLQLDGSDPIVSNLRHHEALTSALEALHRVQQALSGGLPCDLITPDLRHALHHLAAITHREITPDSTLQSIFREFCVGK